VSGRRGFFALVGGAAVSGLVTTRASATGSTLIMPPAGLVLPPAPSTTWPLLEAEPDRMRAFIHIGMGMPEDVFHDWLEGGLRMAALYTAQGLAGGGDPPWWARKGKS